MRKVLAASLLLTSCTVQHRPPPLPPVAIVAPEPTPTPTPIVPLADVEFLAADSPEVQEAFDKYVKSGKAPVIVNKSSGFVQWPFGLSQPTARCRILEVCRIELEPGEEVLNVMLGDSARWTVEKAISGPPDQRITHLGVKPFDLTPDMKTTLNVFTDRRVYDIRLISQAGGPLIRARFWYPKDMMQQLNEHHAQQPKPAPIVNMAEVIATRSQYTIEGNQELRPSMIGNDGTHTYFLMPLSLHNQSAPVLFELSPSGTRTQVNYRLVDGYYKIDKLISHAVLVWGVDRDEKFVEITRGQP